MKVFKEAHVKFSGQTYWQCVYVIKFKSYSWWLAVILDFASCGCGTIGDYDGSSSDVELYPEERL